MFASNTADANSPPIVAGTRPRSPTLRRAEAASRGKVIGRRHSIKTRVRPSGAFGLGGFGQTFLIDTEEGKASTWSVAHDI